VDITVPYLDINQSAESVRDGTHSGVDEVRVAAATDIPIVQMMP
jgi:hypothetical protein